MSDDPPSEAGAPQPAWPALLCLHGCEELVLLSAAAPARDWLASHRLVAGDELVDSRGGRFVPRTDGTWMRLGTLPLEILAERVRRHLAAQGQCCVGKLALYDYAEGAALVGASGA